MANKEEKMINYLLQTSDFVSIDKISADCLISKRTVYNYLQKLKDDPRFTIEKKKNAVYLTAKNNEKFVSKTPEDYQQRKRWIFRKGLIMQKELNIEKLLNFFGISEATFHSDIINIRKEISKFHVRLVTKKGKLMFVGNYHDLKKLTQHVIYQENNETHSLLSTENLTEIFPNLDVQFVKNTITNELQKSNYFMDEYSVVNLLLHILISTNQELNGIVPVTAIKTLNINEVIARICSAIEEKYHFTFSDSAKQQFSLIMETRTRNDDTFDTTAIKHEMTLPLVNEIFQKLLASYNIDINESVFKRSFALHIDSMLSRLESGVVVNNPLFSIIKQSSPITYDLAIFATNIISNQTGYQISESEIAYIALHIGTKIEEIRTIRTRLRAAIVCPEYYMYNSNLRKIIEIYKDDLYITDVYTSFDDVEKVDDLDLIICTVVSSRPITKVRLLKVSLFLTSSDRKDITDTISAIKKQNRIDRSKASVSSLFKKELFFADVSFNDRNEAIEFMSNQLYVHDYVPEDYKKAVLYREDIAPTDFNLIAIPHPVECSAKQTVITVCLLNKQLLWSRSNVSIIFMMGINNKDFEMFEDILSSLKGITEDNNKIKSLLSCKEYDAFINKFIELICENELYNEKL